ncbi:YjjG family noncanonical pyrimidine nucleotidase [Maribellus sediminis]|uniref:YjjG family noncanonical pyrimidine nucleotidase n=1 Tax=Maribellus sediminis TaxID=2696285 RepID=UPI00142FE203|nr:YjjG family noncanonical pyrimidine nucleotidase [Maribellus sediminis]
MQKKYTHLFFDLDNTLWDFKSNSKLAMLSTFQLLGLDTNTVPFEDFYAVYAINNEQLWTAYRNKQVKKKDLTFQRFQFTFDELGISGIDAARMNDLYLDEMPKQKNLMPGAKDLLDYLKAKNYHLYIITNGFKEVQHKKLKSSGLEHYFTKIFISEELRTPKPHPEIFEHALTSANAKKSRSLMIGDDWEVDILGALRFGINAVYFNPLCLPNDKSHNPANPSADGAFVVKELKSIIAIV